MMEDHNSEHSTPEHKAEHHTSTKVDMPPIPKVDFKNVNADSLKGGFSDVIEIIKLNKGAMDKVAHRDAEGINIALIYLAIGAVAAPLGSWILGYSLLGVTIHSGIVGTIIQAVFAVVMAAVVLYITNLVAEKMFQGHAKFPQYFRVMGYAYLLNVVGFFGQLAALIAPLSPRPAGT